MNTYHPASTGGRVFILCSRRSAHAESSARSWWFESIGDHIVSVLPCVALESRWLHTEGGTEVGDGVAVAVVLHLGGGVDPTALVFR